MAWQNSSGDSAERKNEVRVSAVEDWCTALRGPSAGGAQCLFLLIFFFFFHTKFTSTERSASAVETLGSTSTRYWDRQLFWHICSLISDLAFNWRFWVSVTIPHDCSWAEHLPYTGKEELRNALLCHLVGSAIVTATLTRQFVFQRAVGTESEYWSEYNDVLFIIPGQGLTDCVWVTAILFTGFNDITKHQNWSCVSLCYISLRWKFISYAFQL